MAITDEIPKSRITLTYRTEISGQREERKLPFRMLVMGDLSLENTKDAETRSAERDMDLDQRLIRDLNGKNLDSVMRDMAMGIKFTVPNKISGGEMAVDLPIEGMRSFTPEHIVKHVGQLKALGLFKTLLTELQGAIDNRKDFRNAIRDFNNWRRRIAEIPTEVAAVREQIEAAAQDPMAQNKLTEKLQNLETEKANAEAKLAAFLQNMDQALQTWDGFKLPDTAGGGGSNGSSSTPSEDAEA